MKASVAESAAVSFSLLVRDLLELSTFLTSL